MSSWGMVRPVPREPSKEPSKYFPKGEVPESSYFFARYCEYEDRLVDNGWKKLGAGRQRAVFEHPSAPRVIKVSMIPVGVAANHYEWYYAKRRRNMVLAETSTGKVYSKIPLPHVFGLGRAGRDKILSVLTVERVERAENGFALARTQPWVHDVDVDSGPQVGYTADGRLVCFDWARF